MFLEHVCKACIKMTIIPMLTHRQQLQGRDIYRVRRDPRAPADGACSLPAARWCGCSVGKASWKLTVETTPSNPQRLGRQLLLCPQPPFPSPGHMVVRAGVFYRPPPPPTDGPLTGSEWASDQLSQRRVSPRGPQSSAPAGPTSPCCWRRPLPTTGAGEGQPVCGVQRPS